MFDLAKYSEQIVAIDEYGNNKTYAELVTFSNEVALKLPTRNFIFSFCENSIGALFGYVSFINNRSVPLMLNRDFDEDLVRGLVKRYKPSHFWIPKDLANIFYSDTTNVVMEAFGYELISTGFDDVAMHDDLALLLPTSGSTGSPKLVKLSYENIESNALSIINYLEIDKSERPITSLPMNYSYGLSIINSHLIAGATILLTTKSIMQREFWDFFKEQKATSLSGVPYNYQILKKIRFFKMSLPSLRYMTQAGGRLEPDLQREFAEYAQKNALKFVVMYGQTEATARMGYLPWHESLSKCGYVGIAIPGGEFSLIDDAGNQVNEANVTGELVYEGANVFLGYSEVREDLMKGNEHNGTLYTGDMAQFDTDGHFKIVGRKKRFIKLFGNRINLDSAEQIVRSHFKDFESVCSGNDDKMYVFVTTDNSEVKAEVRKYLSHKIGIHFSGLQIESIDSIPKNESGKVQYKKLPF
ncbi:AMP-binding protein [Vibrio tapetis subsp. quintayensis]|uniref:AMP-binding protein n=1 Tax=Vibrio tapetis TaxID=52443 RepID=UPI0025B5C497|nr:AMP-binding protein [Vibrio tapetis]MDN3679458.1 AMP-binding protein [Vibrio tapetis subsp. quintayensis]